MEGFSRSEPRRGVGRVERWTDCGRVSGALPPTFTREETEPSAADVQLEAESRFGAAPPPSSHTSLSSRPGSRPRFAAIASHTHLLSASCMHKQVF